MLPPVMLIDAYNIINQDTVMKGYMHGQQGPRFARAELEDRVRKYAAATGCHCIVVYDAMGQYRDGRAEAPRWAGWYD
jgi:predicted RNA-binding protein with PIN domain